MMAEHIHALPEGYRLHEYELVRVLGAGGFGITYLCFDHNLDQARAIKEYLPADLATRVSGQSVRSNSSSAQDDFDAGLNSFLIEAKMLARFEHRNIVKVHRCFSDNGTAYIVMEYAEGDTLDSILKEHGTLDEQTLLSILLPIMDGLDRVHAQKTLHRDIKPGNVIIRDSDNSPVLIDFGAARQAIESKSRSITAIITAGFAPFEQYSSYGNQGPWTDIYALGAMAYLALCGEKPPEAPLRMRNDPMIPLAKRCAGKASPAVLEAIDWALRPYEEERPQSIAEWRAAFEGKPFNRPATPLTDSDPTIKVAAAQAMSTPRPAASVATNTSAPAQRNVRLWAGVAAVTVVAAAGIFYATGPRSTSTDFLLPLTVELPAGSYVMGSEPGTGDPDEWPSRQVTLARPLTIGQQEVTVEEYRAFADATGRPQPQGNATLPVTGVSWQDAKDYANWLSQQSGTSYRLPSEAEWEYAARRGSPSAWPWGESADGAQVVCAGCDGTNPTGPVSADAGSRLNWAAGDLFNMHGNVWEWVEDCARDSYVGAPADGSVWTATDANTCSRILRGGSWREAPPLTRSAFRDWKPADTRRDDIGFRLVKEVTR
ncbi:MAG: bifunctional serine/threonine-protein kinase/formylglycine-generating enzyme family protein [Pseudohongiella sp.]|nr:bifunctional serine/threonine-protein kinase/formylglycine-generating enzyme family protein [Pseudohongiella sp.]